MRVKPRHSSTNESGEHCCQAENGDTAAHWAGRWGQTECVRILAQTDRVVHWNKRNEWGQAPLNLALINGHSDIVDIIVQQPNIDYNVKTDVNETLAQAAVLGGNAKCVETLAAQERCECWNVSDINGYTPIIRALREGKTEMVEILLRCPRVDLNCRDKAGWSLVFRAIWRNKLGEEM